MNTRPPFAEKCLGCGHDMIVNYGKGFVVRKAGVVIGYCHSNKRPYQLDRPGVCQTTTARKYACSGEEEDLSFAMLIDPAKSERRMPDPPPEKPRKKWQTRATSPNK